MPETETMGRESSTLPPPPRRASPPAAKQPHRPELQQMVPPRPLPPLPLPRRQIPPRPSPPPPRGRVREVELSALYLLRNQRLGLLRLWNRSYGHGEGFPSNAAEIRSSLVDQIKLNKEIQRWLLLSLKVGIGNVSELVDGGVASQFEIDACKKVAPASGRRRIDCKPKAKRYLFAICVSNQMSNHLICLEKHMFFAALLDPVLVLPSPPIRLRLWSGGGY